MSPSVMWCQNQCLHCWRPIELTEGKDMKRVKGILKPVDVINECINLQRKMLTGFKGNPKVSRKKYKEDLWEFIASGGMQKYKNRLEKQYDGEELTKEEKEAMDRTERLFPFIKSRKRRGPDDSK